MILVIAQELYSPAQNLHHLLAITYRKTSLQAVKLKATLRIPPSIMSALDIDTVLTLTKEMKRNENRVYI
jgi:hypothetical protein